MVGMLFWGYVDDQGHVEVKRYVDDKTIRNFESLPFVKGVFDPFYAPDVWQARHMILSKYNEVMQNEKNNRN